MASSVTAGRLKTSSCGKWNLSAMAWSTSGPDCDNDFQNRIKCKKRSASHIQVTRNPRARPRAGSIVAGPLNFLGARGPVKESFTCTVPYTRDVKRNNIIVTKTFSTIVPSLRSILLFPHFFFAPNVSASYPASTESRELRWTLAG